MNQYSEQIESIKRKLIEAEKSDKKLKVFGAENHKYIIHKTATEEEVNTFEKKYKIELPNCYKTFLLNIGNGGDSYKNSGAGPFYGIYPLGQNVDELICERNKPNFTFELNFLDWYERWLNEIISEDLIKDSPSWFGYTMGGSETEILKTYFTSIEKEIKQNCLSGILNKQSIETKTKKIIEEEYIKCNSTLKTLLLQILTKFDYKTAKPYLLELTKTDLLSVFKFINWYSKEKSLEWLETIESNIDKINDDETFRYCTYLLAKMNIDFSCLIIPFTNNPNDNIRVTAFYTLGRLENKSKYIDTFITGLSDNSTKVIHSVLQALSGIKDNRLLTRYKKIAERFPIEQDYILVNLNHRLKEFGLSISSIKETDTGNLKKSKK